MIFQMYVTKNRGDKVQAENVQGDFSVLLGKTITLEGKSYTAPSYLVSVSFKEPILAFTGNKTSEILFDPYNPYEYYYKDGNANNYKKASNYSYFLMGDISMPASLLGGYNVDKVGHNMTVLSIEKAWNGRIIVDGQPTTQVFIATQYEKISSSQTNNVGDFYILMPNGSYKQYSKGTPIYYSDSGKTGVEEKPKEIGQIGTPMKSEMPALKVYPNPAREQVNIEIPQAAEVKSICITDSSGKMMELKGGQLYGGKAEINLTGMASGAYYISVQSKDGSVLATGKFIKE